MAAPECAGADPTGTPPPDLRATGEVGGEVVDPVRGDDIGAFR
jgi:hypothetical protein